MFNVISFEKLLKVTADDLAVIKENLGYVYMDKTIDNKIKYVALAEAFNKVEEWSSYYHRFNKIQDSKINELNNENVRLVEENKRLSRELDELKAEVNEYNGTIGKLQATIEYKDKLIEVKNNAGNMVQVDLVEMIEKLDNAVNMIDENAKALTLSRKLKTEPKVSKHGMEHPRYNISINNDNLVADYNSGMTLKDLSNKYPMSVPGIRNRLMDLGVYKKVYNKDK